jgi:hypothetical protein
MEEAQAEVSLAKVIAGLIREIRKYSSPFHPPVALISGGECTVTIRGEGGRGARCSEFLLSLGIELEPGVHAMAADTDGIDGSEDNAGAFLSPDTLSRANAKALDARALLAKHDSYGFFSALGDLLVTGPTRTNVNDYRARSLGDLSLLPPSSTSPVARLPLSEMVAPSGGSSRLLPRSPSGGSVSSTLGRTASRTVMRSDSGGGARREGDEAPQGARQDRIRWRVRRGRRSPGQACRSSTQTPKDGQAPDLGIEKAVRGFR